MFSSSHDPHFRAGVGSQIGWLHIPDVVEIKIESDPKCPIDVEDGHREVTTTVTLVTIDGAELQITTTSETAPQIFAGRNGSKHLVSNPT